MKTSNKRFSIGDVVILKNSSGYYAAHEGRLRLKNIRRSNDEGAGNTFEVLKRVDEFLVNKKMTVIGFQELGKSSINTGDPCIILRYGNKSYWYSIGYLKRSIVIKVDKTNPRRMKDIIKRYWENR